MSTYREVEEVRPAIEKFGYRFGDYTIVTRENYLALPDII